MEDVRMLPSSAVELSQDEMTDFELLAVSERKAAGGLS